MSNFLSFNMLLYMYVNLFLSNSLCKYFIQIKTLKPKLMITKYVSFFNYANQQWLCNNQKIALVRERTIYMALDSDILVVLNRVLLNDDLWCRIGWGEDGGGWGIKILWENFKVVKGVYTCKCCLLLDWMFIFLCPVWEYFIHIGTSSLLV